jgi:hypothetical protein
LPSRSVAQWRLCRVAGHYWKKGGALEFGLLCKDGREVRYHWNRQFDDFTTSMFIIGDRVPAARRRTRAALPAAAAQRDRGLSLQAQ